MAGEAVYVDASYRTGLGVSFYDRVREVEALGELVEAARTVVVYGPRNVGKSELARYWARRRARGVHVVAVEADLLRVKGVEGLGEHVAVLAGPSNIAGLIASKLKTLPYQQLSLLDVAYTIYTVARRLAARKTVVLIDEFHLLPSYDGRGSRERVIGDLEALAHWLAKRPGEELRVLLTASEGFVALGDVVARLHGYNVEVMVVEHIDERHFRMLYEEYRSLHGCHVGFELVYGIAGGAPGYLPELCKGANAVLRFIERSKLVLEDALRDLRKMLAREYGREVQLADAVKMAYSLLGKGPLSPLEHPLLVQAGRLLVAHNIAYPRYEGGGVVFNPQLPLYKLLLEEAAGRGGSIAGIEAASIMARLEGR